eukprot:2527044-Pleurochrysis_carterae.AAC.2
MAVERQTHRIRREGAGNKMGESITTKPRTGIKRYGHGHSEEPRYAPLCPRVGQLWTLEVPLPGSTQAGPGHPSQAECKQRTRGRARALAGPEPAVEFGRNRLDAGEMCRNRSKTIGRMMHCMWISLTLVLPKDRKDEIGGKNDVPIASIMTSVESEHLNHKHNLRSAGLVRSNVEHQERSRSAAELERKRTDAGRGRRSQSKTFGSLMYLLLLMLNMERQGISNDKTENE